MRRSIQRWRWLARVGDHRRPHRIVDRWTERSLMAASEWEIRAARVWAARRSWNFYPLQPTRPFPPKGRTLPTYGSQP